MPDPSAPRYGNMLMELCTLRFVFQKCLSLRAIVNSKHTVDLERFYTL